MTIYWGINALNHDASLAIFKDQQIVQHLRSANDTEITPGMIEAALEHGRPDKIYWYENPWFKKSRQLYAGQFSDAFDLAEIPEIYLAQFGINGVPVIYGHHHHSHAAAGYYASGFNSALVFVADAIGEWDTFSVWHGQDSNLVKLYSLKYPYSLGLFYSAFTKLMGYRPVRDEYLVTKMSQQGSSELSGDLVRPYLQKNCHRGIKDWKHDIDVADLAAGVQSVFISELERHIRHAKQLVNTEYSVFMGGCAYNKPARQLFARHFKNTYTMYFAGDAGSSIGAVLADIKVKIPLPSIDSFTAN